MGEGAANATVTISSCLQDVGTCLTTALDMISDNPIALVFIGFGLVGGGIALFRKLRKGA